MNIKKVSMDIIGGPDKLALIAALSAAYDKNNPVFPGFKVRLSTQLDRSNFIRLKIIGICHEDGSGQSFLIKGFIAPDQEFVSLRNYSNFEAYYNAQKRSGKISIW